MAEGAGHHDARHPWQRPLGAIPQADGSTVFRVWARDRAPTLLVAGDEIELEDEGFGVHAATVAGVGAGADYEYDVGGARHPDPCSRWQPHGLRGASRVLDPGAFAWSDSGFAPAALTDQVIYELHVGTFTAAGTFDAAIADLPRLAQLGVTALELMPVAEFPGERGWGYDGVYLFAAQSSYGGPAALQRLVDAAHGHGLAVILDVVYNHLGASGAAAMEAFGPYFTDHYATFWGRAINFDGEHSDPVREWVCQSAEHWVRDFHVDGLRLDAIHAIYDSRPEPIVAEVARRVHAIDERKLVIAESGMNDPRVMRPPSRGGLGCDAAWADDFHHALRALLTGERDGWYAEFGGLDQLAKAFRRPHVHDGSYSSFRKRRHGAPADDVPPERFVVFSQNHDQVGNRAFGDRLPAELAPLAALCVLLSPFTPMLFMGQEYGERAPFQFFSDHIDPEIAQATREGRRREFASFAQFGEEVPDPQDPRTFARSKLTRAPAPGVPELYAELLDARARLGAAPVTGVELDEQARWLLVRRGQAEIVCNFGSEPVGVTVRGTTVAVSTHPSRLDADTLTLAPFAGALVL